MFKYIYLDTYYTACRVEVLLLKDLSTGATVTSTGNSVSGTESIAVDKVKEEILPYYGQEELEEDLDNAEDADEGNREDYKKSQKSRFVLSDDDSDSSTDIPLKGSKEVNKGKFLEKHQESSTSIEKKEYEKNDNLLIDNSIVFPPQPPSVSEIKLKTYATLRPDPPKPINSSSASVTPAIASGGLACTTCGGDFPDAAAHRLHFKYADANMISYICIIYTF